MGGGAGVSWGRCGAIVGLKWPIWGGWEGKVLDTSRIRTIPPGLGLRVLGSRRGQQALGRCWALKGVERETLAPAGLIWAQQTAQALAASDKPLAPGWGR